jgi:hypothetical protein
MEFSGRNGGLPRYVNSPLVHWRGGRKSGTICQVQSVVKMEGTVIVDTNQRLQEAIAAARSGQLAEARTIAEELTEENPQNAHAWFLRGILSEDEEQQLAYLSKTLEIDPDHKAARKRLEQLQPSAAEGAPLEAEEALDEEVEAAVEPEAEAMEPEPEAAEPEATEPEATEPEAEAPEDKTMVADSAAFMAAAGAEAFEEAPLEIFAETPPAAVFEEASAGAVEKMAEEPAEAPIEATLIAKSPFAEEMTPEDLEVEALFAQAPSREEGEQAEDEVLATVIAAALQEDEEGPAGAETGEAPEEGAEEGETFDVSDLAQAAGGATVVAQDAEAWFQEEAGEDLWAKVEAEAVPDWLIEDTSSEADETQAEEAQPETVAGEAEVTRENDLPDWLMEEPEESWSGEVEEAEDVFEEAPATVVTATPPAELELPEEPEAPAEAEEEPEPPRPKKQSSTRTLELLLLLLIIVAVALVALIAILVFQVL